ncbi:MAG TPA: protease modulator HflC [Gemmataceae bacterium]|jgi:membrane protease subunit HflC|nr:protease modulator HflC [Gemmataceae bacterium]
MRRVWLIIGIVVAIVWLQSALYSVDQAEFGYVTRFGDPTVTHDGKDDAGLHVKMPWPIDSVTRVDRRLQVFDLPATETLTRDRMGRTVDKTIAVDAFVCWRIPDAAAADRFIRTVGTPEQARRLLTPRLTGRLAAVISNLPLEDVIQVADAGAVDARSDRLRRQVLGLDKAGEDDPNAEPLPTAVLRDYGIELVEVRLRRFTFPEAVRAGIAERIRSERQRKVTDYQSEGNREYTRIVSEARRDAAKTVAEAKAKRQRIEGEADAEADAIRNEAHSKDREFYAFLQKLAAYKAMLAETRDVLLLSAKNELFDLLLKPPPAAPKEKN